MKRRFLLRAFWSVLLCAFAWLGFLRAVAAEPPPLRKLSAAELAARLRSDETLVLRYRAGLQEVVRFAEGSEELFPSRPVTEPRLLTREQREAVWASWKMLLDYLVALDALGAVHEEFWKLPRRSRETSFLLANAAHAAGYRFALAFLHRADNDPAFRALLNDPVPELGLPGGTYDALKFRFLNVVQAGEFAAWESARRAVGGNQATELRRVIGEDSGEIWKFGGGRGEALTVKNGLQILKNAGHKAWFPVQTGVSEFMGDTKVHRHGVTLVQPAQIAAFKRRLEPGDILLCRSEWYLSNVGLPGFWPHAALYIGTPEQRRSYFDDADVRAWSRAEGAEDFEALLRAKFGAAWTNAAGKSEGHEVRVIESISEGVSFTALEHTAGCDSFAVLCPRLAKRDKAAAILRAFQFAGRPYDFNFDFRTDSALVCTELVCKAYEAGTGKAGLQFPVVQVLGRPVTPANEMVRLFAEQAGTAAQQCDFVTFLDGREKARAAVERDEAAFRESWRRPKWHILVAK
jgi:hypothetical protein